MEINELQVKTKENLIELLRELKGKLLKLRFDLADKKVQDFSQLKKVKKDIARVLTILKSK